VFSKTEESMDIAKPKPVKFKPKRKALS